ncbi:MAG: hypothetical protein AAGH89_00050 [Verrucomicrobiota bacterium]
MTILLLLLILVAAIAFVIAGLVIAFRSKNPVVRWGFGASAAIVLMALLFGAYVLFSGTLLPSPP